MNELDELPKKRLSSTTKKCTLTYKNERGLKPSYTSDNKIINLIAKEETKQVLETFVPGISNPSLY